MSEPNGNLICVEAFGLTRGGGNADKFVRGKGGG